MEKVKLEIESYLFENANGRFRAIPFYELSIDEWIIFDNGEPKYLLDFKRREKPLVKEIRSKLEKGEKLEDVLWKLGRFLGQDWTSKNNINGYEIPGSHQTESIELFVLEDLSELFMDLTFVATDKLDSEIFLDKNKLLATYLKNEDGLESAYIDNIENLSKLLGFIFQSKIHLKEIAFDQIKNVYDLTDYRNLCISIDDLELKFQEWINISARENIMDEYGNLIGIIGYIRRNVDKNHLVLITEKRKHLA